MVRIILVGTVLSATIDGLAAVADSKPDPLLVQLERTAGEPVVPRDQPGMINETIASAPAIPATVRLAPRAVDASFDLERLQREWRHRRTLASDEGRKSSGT